jgi:NitT/TauT family transport system substrate-binding protein
MTDPALAIARKQLPSLRILADTRTAEGVRADLRSRFLSVRRTLLDARLAGRASRILRARSHVRILRTLEWMRAHSPEEIRARMPASFRTDDPATDRDGLRSLQNMLSPDGRITPESAAAVHPGPQCFARRRSREKRSTYALRTPINSLSNAGGLAACS